MCTSLTLLEQNGSRVFFWDANGTAVKGVVKGTNVQADVRPFYLLRRTATRGVLTFVDRVHRSLLFR